MKQLPFHNDYGFLDVGVAGMAVGARGDGVDGERSTGRLAGLKSAGAALATIQHSTLNLGQ